MKTLMTAAMIAALTLSAVAFGQQPGKPEADPMKPEPAKPVGKKVTIEDLNQMLQAMGYETKPYNDKEGKLLGYDVTFHSDGWTIYGDLQVQADGQIWLRGWLTPLVDEKTPPAMLVAMLEASDKVIPAHLLYSAKTKKFVVYLPIANGNVTPVSLRSSIEVFVGAVKAALNSWSNAKAKVEAIAKEKEAEGQPEKPKQ